MTAEGEWWRALYDDLLAEVLLVRADPEEVTETIGFLAAHLDVARGDRLFDQCSGIGSLSVPLARAGFEVVGVDLGAGYAERGSEAALAEGLVVDLRRADAFEFVPERPCRGAFNWWTSFGYAATDDENRRMLECARAALEPGCSFALDTMNVPGVLARFEPRVVTSRETRLGPIELVRESRYDVPGGFIHKEWRYQLADGQTVRHESRVRAYTPPELARLLEEAGFEAVRFVGSTNGEALTLSSPRCIALARRPR
jgi:SAM-dependent methyltransferase